MLAAMLTPPTKTETMFSFLKKKSSKSESTRVYAMPEGEIAYGIGDVHGCFLSLLDILEKIQIDRQASGAAKSTVVFLGDLIDRGPSSKQVLEFLTNYNFNVNMTG